MAQIKIVFINFALKMKKVYWYYIFCLVVLSACSNQTSDVIEVSKIQKMDVNDSEPSEGEDEEFVLMETYNESVRSNTDIIADFCILNQDDEYISSGTYSLI